MPELKRPARENLDVVYYYDWITPPLHGLRQAILVTLRERGKMDPALFKPIDRYEEMNVELIGNLPIAQRIDEYWEGGELERGLELADKSISQNNMIRGYEVIVRLANFRSQKAFEVVKSHLFSKKSSSTPKIAFLGLIRSVLSTYHLKNISIAPAFRPGAVNWASSLPAPPSFRRRSREGG